MPKKEKTNWDNVNMQGFVLDGYVKAYNQIFREIALKTNPQTAMLYLVLLSHRNTKTNNCYPSKELLSREMGVCERTIGNMLTDLYDLGAIDINSGKKGYANSYYFPAEDFYEDFQDDTFQEQPHRRKGKFKKKPKAKKISDIEDESSFEDDDSSFFEELPF